MRAHISTIQRRRCSLAAHCSVALSILVWNGVSASGAEVTVESGWCCTRQRAAEDRALGVVRCRAINGRGEAGREGGRTGEQEGGDGALVRDTGVSDDGRFDGLWLCI